MLQYLLNATAIWALSLLVFGILLHRESYHSYNRFYLLFTLLLGILVPLIQLPHTATGYTALLHEPAMRLAASGHNMAAAPAHAVTEDTPWLLLAYLAGGCIAALILLRDIVQLLRYTAGGRKYTEGNWRIIETGKTHAPFSFRNDLFVQSRAQYSSDEWNMILTHEQRHRDLMHFADLVLLHIVRIAFWFHPLVYLYHRRLLMVHEYQADSVAATQPQTYGRFLLEQAMLHTAPSMTHSFNRSPIKNRIRMISHSSGRASRTRMFVLVALLPLFIVCCSRTGEQGQTETKTNPAVSAKPADTIIVVDPVTGKEIITTTDSQGNIVQPLTAAFAGAPQGTVTLKQILSEPKISCNIPGCEVTGFTISYLPAGADLFGPFKTEGNAVPEKHLEYLRKNSGVRVKIFVENITVKYNGSEQVAPSIVLTCLPETQQ